MSEKAGNVQRSVKIAIYYLMVGTSSQKHPDTFCLTYLTGKMHRHISIPIEYITMSTSRQEKFGAFYMTTLASYM